MSKQITITISDERADKIETMVANEGSDWSTAAKYVRTHMIAGESNLSKLDPQTNSIDENDAFDPEKEILEGLTNEYQEVDDALDNAIDELAEVLEEMADSSNSPVKKKTRKGFKVAE